VPANFGLPVNSSAHESSVTFSKDFKEMYFVRCAADPQKSNQFCSLYYSAFNNEHWSEPVKLDLFNNILWGNTQSSGSCIAVFTPGVVRAQHSDIEGGFPGISNLNVDPFFANSSHFLLSIGSPCIDAGIPGSLYFDPESEALGTAAFPSLGTLQNDMGVYGGQGSFLMPVCTGFSTGILSPSDYANFSIDAFPNPTNSDHVKIRVSKNPGASGLLTLSDFSGREVFRRTYSGDSLVNGEDLDLTGFQNGVYTIRYTGNNLYRDLKFMILR
jgi:hypothetical protein